MRRIGLVLVGFLVLVSVRQVFADGTTTIRGYGPREFAIKSDPDPSKNIEAQVEELYQVIRDDKSRKPDTVLQVWIEGFADKTGPEAENDDYAEKRKKQAHSFLQHKFPEAKVNSISRGTSRNDRAVWVEWKYISIPLIPAVPAPTEKQVVRSDIYIAMFVVVLLASIASFILFFLVKSFVLRKGRNKVTKATEPAIQWIKDLDVGSERYAVKIEANGKFWKSPFFSNSGARIVRDSKRELVKSLKGCLKKDEFNQQKIELIRKGVINVAGER